MEKLRGEVLGFPKVTQICRDVQLEAEGYGYEGEEAGKSRGCQKWMFPEKSEEMQE